jgi:hypothetical protein
MSRLERPYLVLPMVHINENLSFCKSHIILRDTVAPRVGCGYLENETCHTDEAHDAGLGNWKNSQSIRPRGLRENMGKCL